MAESATSRAGLSIERLTSFCDIVEAGSTVAAADKSGVSQGQYSRQIKDLERALEVKLFVREGRYLKLTPDGVRLSAITNAYFSALAELRDGQTGQLKPLRLGGPESVIKWVLLPRFPEVLTAVGGPIDIESRSTGEILEKLEAGRLDLGILRDDAVSEEIEAYPFATLTYALVVPRSFLPDKSATGIKEVDVLPMVGLTGEGQFVRRMERVLAKNELTPRVVARVERFSLAIDLAKTLGVATFVPANAVAEFPSETFAPVSLDQSGLMDRKLVIGASKRTAAINNRSRRAALRISRAFESVNSAGS